MSMSSPKPETESERVSSETTGAKTDEEKVEVKYRSI